MINRLLNRFGNCLTKTTRQRNLRQLSGSSLLSPQSLSWSQNHASGIQCELSHLRKRQKIQGESKTYGIQYTELHSVNFSPFPHVFFLLFYFQIFMISTIKSKFDRANIKCFVIIHPIPSAPSIRPQLYIIYHYVSPLPLCVNWFETTPLRHHYRYYFD